MSDESSTEPTMRLHLPSPDEICHSTLLIEQLHKDIGDKTAKIEAIDTKETPEMEEYLRRTKLIRREIEDEWEKTRDIYRSVLSNIDNMYQTEWKKERARRDAEISILKAQRREIEKKAELERAFISPIRKLPTEIYSEIFMSCILGGTATRYTLARVCRSWKHIVLHTPRLWSKIAPHEWAYKPLEQLQARLRLTGRAPLDVTLRDFSYGLAEEIKVNIHKEFAKHGVERWRSLTILAWSFTQPNDYLLGIYTGKFTSLRHFIIDGMLSPEEAPSFNELFGLIADSQPPLQTLDVSRMTTFPLFTQETTLTSSLNSLSCQYEFFQEIIVPSTLTSITLQRATSEIDGIFENVTKVDLSSCSWRCAASFPNVTDLILKEIVVEGLPEETLHFPQLQILDIVTEDPAILRSFSAPRLEQLFICPEPHSKQPSVSLSTLETFKSHLPMAPTVLSFGFEVSTPALRSICAVWPQIKHAEFCLDKKQKVQGAFVAMLSKRSASTKAQALCPGLDSLKLEISSTKRQRESETEVWQGYSKQLFACRDALKVIECSWPKLYCRSRVYKRGEIS